MGYSHLDCEGRCALLTLVLAVNTDDRAGVSSHGLPLRDIAVFQIVLVKPFRHFIMRLVFRAGVIGDIEYTNIDFDIIAIPTSSVVPEIQRIQEILKHHHIAPIYSYIYGPCFVGSYSDVQVSM